LFERDGACVCILGVVYMRSTASQGCVGFTDRFAAASTWRRRALRGGLVVLCAGGVLACGSGNEAETVLEPLGRDTSPNGAAGASVLLPPAEGLPAGAGGQVGLVGFVDDESGGTATCVDQFAELTERPPVIEFVVDTSGSMSWVAGTERLPGAGEQSKWDITAQALVTAIAAMPDAAAVGISYYPNTGGGFDCFRPEVAAPIERLAPEHRAQIEAANQGRTPVGGTPTHAAYEFGVEQLRSSTLQGSKFLVLITDGIPTYTLECGGDGQTRVDGAPLVDSVGEHFRADAISTFVIGSPGSEAAREELSEMAFLGGTGASGCENVPGSCHFDMTGDQDFSLALRGALGDIAEATVGCDYAVPPPPRGRARINLDDVSVVVESAGVTLREFGRASSAECESGWQYTSDRSSIVLCRSTCDELARLADENPDVAVRVRFGCDLTPT